MRWIDTHCHLFTAATADETTAKLPHGMLNTVQHYWQALTDQPDGIVIVDFSKAKTSDHVIAALDAAQKDGLAAKGIIRGNMTDPRTLDWLKRPDVAGARLYALQAPLDFADNRAEWNRLFAALRQHGQHLCLFGNPATLLPTLRALPDDLPVLIDHLGMPDASRSANQHDYALLLAQASSRSRSAGPVYFKGPGYRTSLDPARVVPFLQAIRDKMGDTALLLGASDAPFAGPVAEKSLRYEGQPYNRHIGYASITPYLRMLISLLAEQGGKGEEMLAMQLLYRNAAQLYRFGKAAERAA